MFSQLIIIRKISNEGNKDEGLQKMGIGCNMTYFQTQIFSLH